MSGKRNQQLKHKIFEELGHCERERVVAVWEFVGLIFHHVPGHIMTHIKRFEGYHRGVVEDSVLLGCDALGTEGTALFGNVGKTLTGRRSFSSQKT